VIDGKNAIITKVNPLDYLLVDATPARCRMVTQDLLTEDLLQEPLVRAAATVPGAPPLGVVFQVRR
jgi:hypothetical protein